MPHPVALGCAIVGLMAYDGDRIPVVNPDGLAFSWGVDRFWRKNRRDNNDSSFGVDLNRNFDANWGGGGSSGVFPPGVAVFDQVCACVVGGMSLTMASD